MSSYHQRSDHSQSQLGKGDGGPSEAAGFIADALADLKMMAGRHSLTTLTYLLDLAHMEAEEIAGSGIGKP